MNWREFLGIENENPEKVPPKSSKLPQCGIFEDFGGGKPESKNSESLPPTYSQEVFPCPICNGTRFRKGERGGYFCLSCTDEPPAGVDILARGKRKCLVIDEAKPTYEVPSTRDGTPPGKEWVKQHQAELKALGWTPPMLYRDKLPVGLIHIDLFRKQGVSVEINGENVVFSWTSQTGQLIRQVCYPEERFRANRGSR